MASKVEELPASKVDSVEVKINSMVDEIVERWPQLNEISYSLYCDIVDIYIDTGEFPEIDLEQFSDLPVDK